MIIFIGLPEELLVVELALPTGKFALKVLAPAVRALTVPQVVDSALWHKYDEYDYYLLSSVTYYYDFINIIIISLLWYMIWARKNNFFQTLAKLWTTLQTAEKYHGYNDSYVILLVSEWPLIVEHIYTFWRVSFWFGN